MIAIAPIETTVPIEPQTIPATAAPRPRPVGWARARRRPTTPRTMATIPGTKATTEKMTEKTVSIVRIPTIIAAMATPFEVGVPGGHWVQGVGPGGGGAGQGSLTRRAP